MSKKLITLAVAAAVAAPTAAIADATLYGQLNVSIDYQNVDNLIQPWYNDSAFGVLDDPEAPGYDYFILPDGTVSGITVPTGTPLTPEQARALQGYTRIAPGQTWSGDSFDGWGMNRGRNMQGSSRSSRIGVKGSEDLGNGLKAIYQVEFNVALANEQDDDVTNGDRSNTIAMRNSFVGLTGQWGTFLIGRHDTPLKIATGVLDLFADTMADYNGTIGFQDYRADNAIAYISPSWSGFQLLAALVPSGGATVTGATNLESDQLNGAYSLAGIYSNGPFFASLAYESLDNDMFMGSSTALNGCYLSVLAEGTGTRTEYRCDMIENDQNTWKIGLGLLDWNGFTLTGIYEEQNGLPTSSRWVTYTDPTLAQYSYDLPSGPDSRQLWQIQAGYAFGNFMLKAMYGETSYEGDYRLPNLHEETAANAALFSQIAKDLYEGGTSSWGIGVDYNFSKRTKAYALYTSSDSDQGDTPRLLYGPYRTDSYLPTTVRNLQWDGFSLGIMHIF